MPPPITPLPDPPLRSQQPNTFAADAEAFMEALPVFQTEINDTATFVDDKATQAEGFALSLEVGTAGGWIEADTIEEALAEGAAHPDIDEGDGFFWQVAGRFGTARKVGGIGVLGAEFMTQALALLENDLGTMSLQDAAAVAITGGTIAGVPVADVAAVETLTAAGAVAAGDFVNIHASSGAKVRKADATNAAKKCNGFAPAAIADTASGTVQGPGTKVSGLAGLTPGATYWLSTTPGLITDTPPSSDNVIQKIGVAVSATELFFNPDGGIDP